MLTIKQSRILWAWVCPITGAVLDEGWGNTKPYTTYKSTNLLGKRRAQIGEFRAVRVTVELLTDAEQTEHELAYEEWERKKKDEEEARALRQALKAAT